ncbi:hypothetical protein M9458_058086, partial [Cirrhinus mrigala]
ELRCSQGRSTQRNFIVIFSELRAALRAGVLNLIHFVVILVNYAPQVAKMIWPNNGPNPASRKK